MAKCTTSADASTASVEACVEPRELLIHTLREQLAHTGPHIGCETSTAAPARSISTACR